jgi:hypothetical protein
MFLTTDNKLYIGIVIKSILSNLNNTEYDDLLNIYFDLVNFIHDKLLIRDSAKFFEQLKRNKNREIIAILYLLFPYIDDSNNYEKYKLIKNLSDITLLKSNKTYTICNFQYSRGYVNESDNKYQEYAFKIDDIKINFELLKQSIDRIRLKLYINWVNVVPIVLEKYPESNIYKISLKHYFSTNVTDHSENALPVSEIYDTVINDLYLNCLDFKWLLFEKSVNQKIIMYLDILNKIYPVYNIIDNKQNSKWILIDDNLKNKFSKNMDLYFNKAINNQEYNGFSADLLKEFFKYMMIFFDTKYNYTSEIKNYKKIYGYTSYDIDIDDDNLNSKNISNLFDNFKNVDKFYLYDFIRSQILKLSKSWYGFKIFRPINEKKEIIKLNEYKFIDPQDINKKINLSKLEQYYNLNDYEYSGYIIDISYKNIYNFAKSLYFINCNPSTTIEQNVCVLPPLYDNLNKEQKDNINNFTRILRTRVYTDRWLRNNFNIVGNIRKKYNELNLSDSQLRFYNIYIIGSILRGMIDIVFECLCKRGILSEFIIRDERFEKSVIHNPENSSLKDDQAKFGKHLKQYEEAYYYLNDDKYKNLMIITDKKTYKEETYFKRLETMKWYNFYAMDWVSQINFFHHYINQRIVMLTGGTGVGKSSQIPKLLLYGLKAFDKKFNGKVICTQPRISPTTDNTENISKELGVDIKNYNKIYKSMVKTTNGIIQYKYEAGNHIDEDEQYCLRIVTDGSLLVELKNSPLLKQTVSLKRNNFDITNDKFYTSQNLYDIVIVDESHEHNTNMDLILSIIRGSLLINNQLKLYIVSATMEEDDPTYRQYYRFINDNLKYPIRDLYLEDGKFDKLLDRIVIDRRIHISPPGESTQYKITEIYNDVDFTTEQELEAYKLAIKYAQDICINNSAINNDILLFCTTVKKIITLVTDLNKVLPMDTIAIPFYSDLPEESKSLITSNLGQIKKTFKFDRKYIIDVLNNKKKLEIVNSNYKYDRILIVSTNVAEASITIDTLKFVIDTGFNFDVSYNYDTDTPNMQVVKISEASRKQRKGRVGRTSNGTVYYTYPENARLNIKPSYSICKSNFSTLFIDLLTEDSLNYEFENVFFPYIQNQDKLATEYIKKIYELAGIMDNTKINLYVKILSIQYASTKYMNYNQIFSDNLYNINLINSSVYDNIIAFSNNGLNYNNLIDSTLSFYIIHPFEYDILKYRNINNRIIDKLFISKKEELRKEVDIKLTTRLISNLYVYEIDKYIYKVKMIQYISLIKQKTDKLLDLSLFYPIVIGYKLNVFENILFIVNFLQLTKFDIMSIVDNIEKFNKIFRSNYSDLLVINKVFELFKTTYGHLLFSKNIEYQVDESYKKFINNFKNYLNKNFQLIKESKDYNDLIDILLKNNDLENTKEKLNEQNTPSEIPDYVLFEINNWCNMYGINYKSFINIINIYREKYYKYKFIFDKDEYNKFIKKLHIEDELDIDKNIIKSFIYGNIDKLFVYENGKYKPYGKYNSITKYSKNTNKKKWISNVINNRFLLILNKENDFKKKMTLAIPDKDDEETDNNNVLLNIISSIDNKMYSEITYFNDNPSNKKYGHIEDINHNNVCNNPINLEKHKHAEDPKFNEYINILKNSIQEFIDKNC